MPSRYAAMLEAEPHPMAEKTPQDGLTVHDLHKRFGQVAALRGVSFHVARGQIAAILGPSGCGKSTTLSIIAGLERQDRGEVLWDGQPVDPIPPHQRGFGLMFQDLALFPHLNVFENLAFGLRQKGMHPETIKRQVEGMLERVGLAGYGPRPVDTLSGGEQQRVALARALLPHPRLLMLDEPLGALDRALRERLLKDLHQILRGLRQTALYVTHDQEEAFTIADYIILMNEGQVEQRGSPMEIYARPANLFVARFLGLQNIYRAELRRGELHTPFGHWPWPAAGSGQVQVLLRPDALSLDGSGPASLQGELVGVSFRGSFSRLTVQVKSLILEVDVPSTTPLPPLGARVRLAFDPHRALQVFHEHNDHRP